MTNIAQKYCHSLTSFARRETNPVRIGCVTIGGGAPIAVQSMTSTDTCDTQACVGQIVAIRAAGGHVVRLTAQGRVQGENLRNIVEQLHSQGINDVATVADIHFTPDVAIIAAQYVDKVRINPGNYSNTDGQFLRLIKQCRERGVALRIGVNHGSLAPKIVEQWGDTPRGMVESAMEFLRVCQSVGFDQVVVSLKSSNVRVMVQGYRMLVGAMEQENMHFPLHLGVTEAGDGDDARVKSAAGIGALLADGIGDTIRVSLTEPPENEIPVGQALVDYFADRAGEFPPIASPELYTPYHYKPRETDPVDGVGGASVPVLYSELTTLQRQVVADGRIVVLTAESRNPTAEWRAEILNMMSRGDRRPVILHYIYKEFSREGLQLKAAADFGMLFLDGLANGIWIENGAGVSPEEIDAVGLSILQATRVRISKTEYIACPGCGRTLYDLVGTLKQIRSRTDHLVGLKIGVMGCIVNGPGEMADADYGYVGAGRGRITLYRGSEVVHRDIEQGQALDALIELIKQDGKWVERVM